MTRKVLRRVDFPILLPLKPMESDDPAAAPGEGVSMVDVRQLPVDDENRGSLPPGSPLRMFQNGFSRS